MTNDRRSVNRRSQNRRSRNNRRQSWFRRRPVYPSTDSEIESSSSARTTTTSNSNSTIGSFLQRTFSRNALPSAIPTVPIERNPNTAIPLMDIGPSPLNPFMMLAPEPSKLVFDCQLAHGSATAKITNVSSLSEMYKVIASKFAGVNAEDILFCTVNTHKVDMDKLLSSNLALDDFIFAHLKGQKKEITFTKKSSILGLTVTDNSNGCTFIKRIQPDSVSATVQPAIDIGDQIEKINGESMVGKRHFQVARVLRALPIGSTVTLRLISPMKSGFSFLSKRPEIKPRSSLDVGTGSQTIRFFANGNAQVQEAPDRAIIEKINKVFEEYLGVNDDDLALSIWELGRACKDLMEMNDNLRKSEELSAFSFPDELIFDMWGIVSDHKENRIKSDVTGKDNVDPTLLGQDNFPQHSVHPVSDDLD